MRRGFEIYAKSCENRQPTASWSSKFGLDSWGALVENLPCQGCGSGSLGPFFSGPLLKWYHEPVVR